MIVLDASALVELLLRTPRAARVAARLARHAAPPQVPHLIDLEVLSALHSLEARKLVSAGEAKQAVTEHLALPLVRYPHDPLVARIWALRGNLTVYDAAYVALAAQLRAPLVTCDAQLAAAPGLRVAVELIA
jgi:predicted nucleic acid-binding protein